MQKITRAVLVIMCLQTLTGCTVKEQEHYDTVTEEQNPVIKVIKDTVPETEIISEVVTSTAIVTTTVVAETTVVTTATALTTIVPIEPIEEVTTTVMETMVEETTTEEILNEIIAESAPESTEEIQEAEELTEQADIVYISYSWDDDYYYFDDFTITTEDYILLCNCVAHEAGSDWYSDWEKAKVVEVIFNRMWSSAFPDTIYEVITQPNQFTGSAGYANLNGYSYEVTGLCCDGVDLYLSNPDLFNEGYLFFYGNNYVNYFY